ncbi:DNA polymerase Y family protein [Ramlibacter sp. USB13]|uniref:DNA polymerase Y family protein n=1 Tax=Ramlibacter cellulosilyticus TaxID=2764187 RepID=A0A923SGH8_9BURK|nr:DNA polymerase Y family protein [Ramlibacter cellulosilyticus]MBC5784947.1 DNA polymerase Y family protein [Ramlibacter cellulosilyticus]
MYWIALQPLPHDDAKAWGWRALQFTPRVACVDEALLLEVGASERLFGGRKRLLRRLLRASGLETMPWAAGPTSLMALSLLRLQRGGQSMPLAVPWGLPLATFTAAQAHLDTLERVGVTTLGELRELPRAGVARRFGSELLDALDRAWGDKPERYEWLSLPAVFDENQELPELATSAPELLQASSHLLHRLQAWLQARNLGVLALELEWTLDLRRIDGKPLPSTEKVELRTAQPTQDMRHLRRLASERLTRTTISAPANHLRLRTLETVPWGGRTTSLLPEDQKQGERLHELVERLSVRLGAKNVTIVQPRQDHRPESMQEWVPALSAQEPAPGEGKAEDVLFPSWLLTEPLRLQVKGDQPWYQGPLQLLTRARRIETSWWNSDVEAPVVRDYFIARSEKAGLLWIYRERLSAEQEHAQWFLHGIYA